MIIVLPKEVSEYSEQRIDQEYIGMAENDKQIDGIPSSHIVNNPPISVLIILLEWDSFYLEYYGSHAFDNCEIFDVIPTEERKTIEAEGKRRAIDINKFYDEMYFKEES